MQNRNDQQGYPNSGTTIPGTHNINQQYRPRPNAMGMGAQPLALNNGGGQYFPTPNYQYYPPPPPPPRPPQAIKMMPDPLMPPGTCNPVRVRGPAPPPPRLNGATGFTPLVPPPLPPMFPYMSPELAQSLQESASRCGQSFEQETSDLPFVPVIVNDKDLKKMNEMLKNQIEDTKVKNLLLYEDIIDQGLPQNLRDMFQPLYCKLCKLTLSSPVVARDHYKGKRHKKAEEGWVLNCKNNPSKKMLALGNQQMLPPKPPSLLNGTITPAGIAGNQNFDRRPPAPFAQQYGITDRIPPLLPHSNSNRSPFPVPGSVPNYNNNRKRPAEQAFERPPGNNHDFIPAYRAALASPGTANKKPKKEDGGGPNFGYCELCDVTLTSQANSDQHYNGKKHKEKQLSSRKCGQFGEDPRYGIGSSFPNRPVLPPTPISNRNRR